LKLVLDTNVVLDWLVFEDPAASLLRAAITERRVTVLTHDPALDELRDVIARPRLRLDTARQQSVVEAYLAATVRLPVDAVTEMPDGPEGFPRCRDPDDQPFLSLAYRGKAQALVSRDKQELATARRMRAYRVEVIDLPRLAALIAPS
jgi:putative PIN family toxin of toxin-antitoxin system